MIFVILIYLITLNIQQIPCFITLGIASEVDVRGRVCEGSYSSKISTM